MSLDIVFAKLAARLSALQSLTAKPTAQYFDPAVVVPVFAAVRPLLEELIAERPDLFAEVQIRDVPVPSKTSDNEGRGYVRRAQLDELIRDLTYVFDVRAASQAAFKYAPERPLRVFVSHGRSTDWREVQAFIEKDVGLATLELAQEPNRGRTVMQKLEEESDRCSFAVVVMTGDDLVAEGPPRARENVMHEIGFFQGRYGLSRVCLLHEEGVSIPSNIHGLVYVPYPKGLVSAAFATLMRELSDSFRHR